MECNQCDCPRFIGLAQPDGRRCHGAELTRMLRTRRFAAARAALPPGNGHDEQIAPTRDLRQDTMLSAYAGFGSFRQGTNPQRLGSTGS